VSTTEDDLLDVALEAARAAGSELLERFGGEPEALRSKSTPTDPVSAADIAAEAAIRAVLARRRPQDAILGEEGGESAGDSGLRWVVDPLDGTVNYLYGFVPFGVSVVVEDGDGALAGVVLDPVRDECFTATRSGPPRCNGRPVASRRPESLARMLVATGFAYDAAVRAEQARVLARLLPRVRDVRRAGAAALDLAAAACGRVDAYYERGVKAWDIAAGSLLCARAGLEVRRLAATATLPWGVLVAPADLIDELAAVVA
jgi:myo-inositol-1(or 4)-monophosphatase